MNVISHAQPHPPRPRTRACALQGNSSPCTAAMSPRQYTPAVAVVAVADVSAAPFPSVLPATTCRRRSTLTRPWGSLGTSSEATTRLGWLPAVHTRRSAFTSSSTVPASWLEGRGRGDATINNVDSSLIYTAKCDIYIYHTRIDFSNR